MDVEVPTTHSNPLDSKCASGAGNLLRTYRQTSSPHPDPTRLRKLPAVCLHCAQSSCASSRLSASPEACAFESRHPVALGYHILADGTNRLPCNHLAADGRLDGHFKQLARNLTTQALYHTPTHAIRLVPVNNKTERVHYIPRNQYVQPDKIPHFIALHLIVEAGVTPCAALQDVKEIQDNLCQRKIIC